MEYLIVVGFVVFVVLFLIALIIEIIKTYWPIILCVLAVVIFICLFVYSIGKDEEEKKAAAQSQRDQEIKQLREKNIVIQEQISAYQSKIVLLEDEITNMNRKNDELQYFSNLFSAIGTSKGQVICDNLAAQTQTKQSRIDEYQTQINKLNTEYNNNK